MKSIFELEHKLNIEKEYETLYRWLHDYEEAVIFEKDDYHPKDYAKFIDAIADSVFLEWKYRDTFVNIYEYLDYIGIDVAELYNENFKIEPENFLHYLEFLLNMSILVEKDERIELLSETKATLKNIPKILDKMNYEATLIEDRYVIHKKSADIDSIMNSVEKDIEELLLEYNDYRIAKNIEAKKTILKKLDLFIEGNIKVKSFDSNLGDSIGVIVNKMGINHPINEEPYKSLSEAELIEWYDKCFLMMIHAIRTVDINKIKSQRKALETAKN